MTPHEGCVALNMIPGVGYIRFTELTKAFGSPELAAGATQSELAGLRGIGPQLAERIAKFDWSGELERELAACENAGVDIITLFDPGYPEVLRELYDPPLCLYVRGKLPEFPERAVAVVGSRRMSAYGERMAKAIASDAAAAGFTVVSGLALGVDAAAHTAVVDAAGVTVAVLGGGLKHPHPRENLPLARRIIETGGAVITEFPLDFPVSRTSFPRRNRIVAGLCRGTIVIEAGLASGALITARLALESGRDVFAVPGHADNPQAQGCHALIKDGAALIENFDDVLTAFGCGMLPGFAPDGKVSAHDGSNPEIPDDLPTGCAALLELIDGGEPTLDELSNATGTDTGMLLSQLMTLELKLLVERGPDQRYRRRSGGRRVI